jgi:dipeptidyl aminopeptidase/acylaminoacyl peptidase
MQMHLTPVFLSAAMIWQSLPACSSGDEAPNLAEVGASAESATLSPDGRWFACTVRSGPGLGRLLICDAEGDRRREVASGGHLTFAGDSKSVLYSISSARGLEYVVRDLETWTVKRIFRPASPVSTVGDGRYVVIKGRPELTERDVGRPSERDELLVYSFADDRIRVLGSASLYEINGDGQFVAVANEGPDGQVSVDVLRLEDHDRHRVYDDFGELTSLVWGDDLRSLAFVIAQDMPDGETVDRLVAIDDATVETFQARSIVLQRTVAWPEGAFLDPSPPRAGNAGAVVFFIVRNGTAINPRRPRNDEVEIHRATDPFRYDSLSDSLTENVSPTGGRLFAWIFTGDRILKVAEEEYTALVVSAGGGSVLVKKAADLRPPLADWDIIDPLTETRVPLAPGPVLGVSPSRTGRYVAFFDRPHWWVFDTSDGSRRNLTATQGRSFESDLAMGGKAGEPATNVAWLEGDEGLIAHDPYDAWLLSPDGAVPRRLTQGRERGRVYRLVGGPDFAIGGPYDFHVTERRSKYSGYIRVAGDGTEQVIAFGPWTFDKFLEARGAERFAFQRESHSDPPNFYTASAVAADPRPMTHIKTPGRVPSPRRELIQYRNRGEIELQGTLVFPVDYDETKTYPLVVSIYDIRSDRHFQFHPGHALFDDPLMFASRGYFVLLPDIVYEPRGFGPSAVDCVESAVRAVLSRRLVAPKRVGLVGQSQGGYETLFVLSKSRLFAAGIAVNPPVDLAVHTLSGRKGNVLSELAVWGTVGMTVPFWEDAESYVASSVVYQAHGITTPLLIGVGKQDPVVDYHNGESIFNLLRYLKRPAYLLAYPQAGHGLGDDFARRAQEFLDCHLKGKAPADWMAADGHR